MEERITIDLPIVRVNVEDNWYSCDYGKEHYEKGMFVIDDGINRHFGMWDGFSLWNCPIPHDWVDKYLVERAISDNDEIYHRDIGAIEERLERIEKLCSDTSGELYRQKEARVKGFKAMSERFDTIEKGEDVIMDLIGDMRKDSGSRDTNGGTNVLDVAKAFAVIQKPELIKELNK